jgi:cell division transport system permease protein
MTALLRMVAREIWLNLRGRGSTLLVTLVMVSLSFVVFDVFLLVTYNLGSMLRREKEAIGIEAFLADGLAPEEARSMADLIAGMEEVRSVYYVSPQEAEAIFRSEIPERQEMLDLLSSEYHLPASLQITPARRDLSPATMEELARTVAGMEGVVDVIYGEEYLSDLSGTVAALSRLDLFAGLMLVVSISLVVANTVRLSVSRRSLTVQIMSVAGAPGWFVRTPYLVEGLLSGLVGSALGLGMVAAASEILQGTLGHSFLPLEWSLLVLCLGGAVGLAGSWFGLRSALPRAGRTGFPGGTGCSSWS